MRRIRTLTCLGLALLLLLSALPVTAGAAAPDIEESLTVLFTHDTHDHFLPAPAEGGGTFGGYVRLAALLKEERDKAEGPVVTLDAGDFSMGSLFQTIYGTEAPELRALGMMGYDVTTLGNHEFDYRQQGLADMLNAAGDRWRADHPGTAALPDGTAVYVTYGDALPRIVQANYTTPKGGDAPEALAAALENYPVTPYTVLERKASAGTEPLRIAVFGVLGVDADECAPMSGMALEPMIDAAKRVVAEIQEKEAPDFIICLSHGGTTNGEGEDYELAKAVDGIDLIISGHTHSTLAEPIQVNDTFIVSCGEYTHNLGRITLTKQLKAGAAAAVSDYRLIPIDDSAAQDPEMAAFTEGLKEKVDDQYLSQYGLGFDQTLAVSGADFTIPETGHLIGEAYISTVMNLEGRNYQPIAFAVAPDGVIRGAIRAGEITTADAFDILSLGSGADGSPGYPLVSVYLTGKDLKNAFEVDASVSALMPAAALYGAGSFWRYNPHRMFLDRVTECQVTTQEGGIAGSIANDKLYRVVADLYSGQMLAAVKSKSFGLLSITPRDENGNEVTDFESRILHDSSGNEIKAWYALASYLQEAGSVEPEFIGKAVEDSWNPLALLIPMGAPTAILMAAVLAIILLVVLAVRGIRRRRKNRRTKGGFRPYRG